MQYKSSESQISNKILLDILFERSNLKYNSSVHGNKRFTLYHGQKIFLGKEWEGWKNDYN